VGDINPCKLSLVTALSGCFANKKKFSLVGEEVMPFWLAASRYVICLVAFSFSLCFFGLACFLLFNSLFQKKELVPVFWPVF
jgi:hypothetical protein